MAPKVARPHTTIAELNPVPSANTPSGPEAIMEMLLEFGFTSEDSRPVDVQINGLLIGPLRRLAACFGIPKRDRSKGKFLFGRYVLQGLHARGMLVQEGLEFFFYPTLNAPPDGRVAGFTGSTQAEMGKQTEAVEDTESTLAVMSKQLEAAGSTQAEIAILRPLLASNRGAIARQG